MSAEYRRGDALEILRNVPHGSVDLVLADPPYGMSYSSSRTKNRVTARTIQNDAGFDPAFHRKWLSESFRAARQGAALYAFIDDQHLGQMRECVADAGWHLKRSCVWLKDAWTVGDLVGDYGHQTEFCVFAHKGRHLLQGGRESNVWRFNRVPPDKLQHTTEKPVGLLRYLIRKSAPRDGLILDPFAGVASVGVAAIAEGRNYIGIEIDATWWGIAEKRLAEAKNEAHPMIEQSSLFGTEAA